MENRFCFVVDVGVGITIENWLDLENYKVIPVRSVNAEMEDEAILSMALSENAIIITMDKDFGELVFRENKRHCGVLLLRLEDAVAEEKLAVIQSIFPDHVEEIIGNFAVFQNGRLRIKS